MILTFGTAAYLDNKQQKADGRQTAMLVIHDIEQSANEIDGYIKQEEEDYKLALYVLEHIDPMIDYEFDRSDITPLTGKEKDVLPATRSAGTIFIDRMGKRIEVQDPNQGSYEYFIRKEQ